ncbi:MAG: hypothetical protein AB1540_02925 [Bdellovibrionota bacterium]
MFDAIQHALVDIVPNKIFVPQGYDNNDPRIELVLEGELPGTCHKLGPTLHRVDHSKQKVFIRQKAYFYPGEWCMNVPIYYKTAPIDLGQLGAGNYTIVFESAEQAPVTYAEHLPVAESDSPRPDDYFYASVTNVRVVADSASEPEEVATATTARAYKAILKGRHEAVCTRFDTALVRIQPNRVIEILPIVELGKGRCPDSERDFSIEVKLGAVAPGRYLIHVRSLSGQSVNEVVDF